MSTTFNKLPIPNYPKLAVKMLLGGISRKECAYVLDLCIENFNKKYNRGGFSESEMYKLCGFFECSVSDIFF